MTSISAYLSADHSHCDQLFAEAENAAGQEDWETATTHFGAFRQATLRHFNREEETLFPSFESATGMYGGPTTMMRDEHDQMREILGAMATALERRDSTGYLGLSETLLMLMRQHNLKEEQILYPMCDQALAADASDLVTRMTAQ